MPSATSLCGGGGSASLRSPRWISELRTGLGPQPAQHHPDEHVGYLQHRHVTDLGQYLHLPTEQAPDLSRVTGRDKAITVAMEDHDRRPDPPIDPEVGTPRQRPEQRAACLRERSLAPGRLKPVALQLNVR